MSLTPSAMLPLGTRAPDFTLPDVTTGDDVTLTSFSDKKLLLVMFICRHCPFVKHINLELARLGFDYDGKDIALVAISSNDVHNHPDDHPLRLAEQKEQFGFAFPYLYDEFQDVARDYTAACTPDFFLFNRERQLIYRGQLDDSRPGNNLAVDGRSLREAIEAGLADIAIPPDGQRPSIGCNIKWK
jgi:peroxiredoxin